VEARRRNVRLETRTTGTPPVRCARDKVECVLRNLLVNALRHTPSDGAIAVLVEPAGNNVRVSVEDSGKKSRPTRFAGCSVDSGAPIPPARRTARASVSRSRGASSKSRAGGSGQGFWGNGARRAERSCSRRHLPAQRS
jgi:signal transduction histidine kinase